MARQKRVSANPAKLLGVMARLVPMGANFHAALFVMPGLVPGIHVGRHVAMPGNSASHDDVDDRDKPGHDAEGRARRPRLAKVSAYEGNAGQRDPRLRWL